MKTLRTFVAIAAGLGLAGMRAGAASPVTWEKHVLTDKYYCDGINCGDFNRDGLKDIIVGKRMWAHGPNGDVEPGAAPVLYWFQLTRQPDNAGHYDVLKPFLVPICAAVRAKSPEKSQ